MPSSHQGPERLEGFRCLEGLEPGLLEKLGDSARIRSYRKGSVPIRQGIDCDRLLLVVQGRVKLFRVARSGHQTIHRILGPRECFCFAPLDRAIRTPLAAECLVDSRLILLEQSRLGREVVENPAFTAGVVECMWRRLVEGIHGTGSSRLPVGCRLAGVLVDLAERQGLGTPEGILLESLTHEELAACTGCAREVVSRALSRLRRAGILHTGRGKLVIRDLSRLRERLEPRHHRSGS